MCFGVVNNMKINMHDEIRLIETVQKHSVLFANTEIAYRNLVKKETAWRRVTEDVGSTGTFP